MCSADADEVSTVGSRAGVEKKSGQQKPAWLGYEAGASQQHGAMYIIYYWRFECELLM